MGYRWWPRRVGVVALAIGAVTALATWAPLPSAVRVLAGLPHGGTATAEETLTAALTVLAWATSAQLCTGVVLLLGARVPGGVGRAGGALAAVVVPVGVRRLLEGALGLTLVGAGLAAAAGPALATSTPTASPVASAAPSTAASTAASAAPSVPRPPLDWPHLPPPPAPPPPAPPPPAPPTPSAAPTPPGAPAAAVGPAAVAPRDRAEQPTTVVVRRGDSLWSIAARALGPGASRQQVADAWPRWHDANRGVIGDDPDLLHPGQRLSPPPA